MKLYTTIRIKSVLFALALATLLTGAAVSIKLNRAAAQEKAAQGRRVSPRPAAAEQFTVAVEPSEEVLNFRQAFTNSIFRTRTLRFDVSENAKRFIFDETPLHADGAPAFSSARFFAGSCGARVFAGTSPPGVSRNSTESSAMAMS